MNEWQIFLQFLTALVATLGPLGLWFGLGGKIGRLEARMNGYQKEREDCEKREIKKQDDHEVRIRDLEKVG